MHPSEDGANLEQLEVHHLVLAVSLGIELQKLYLVEVRA